MTTSVTIYSITYELITNFLRTHDWYLNMEDVTLVHFETCFRKQNQSIFMRLNLVANKNYNKSRAVICIWQDNIQKINSLKQKD